MVDEKDKDKLTLVAEIIGIIGGIISILSFILNFTGNNNEYLSIFTKINPLLIAIISIIILIVVAIRKRMNHGKTDELKHWHFTPHKKIASFESLGFKWDVTIPNDEYDLSLENIHDKFDISPEPKCKNCDIKLDSPKDYIIYYKYDCFNCDFTKRKWDCLEKITDHANILFKKEIEKRIKKK